MKTDIDFHVNTEGFSDSGYFGGSSNKFSNTEKVEENPDTDDSVKSTEKDSSKKTLTAWLKTI